MSKYIRSKRLQFHNHHAHDEKIDISPYHVDNYRHSCREVSTRCIRCGTLPRTIGEGIHFSCSLFVKCNDCYEIEPHSYENHEGFGWLFMDNDLKQKTGEARPLSLLNRFKKEKKEEDDDDSMY